MSSQIPVTETSSEEKSHQVGVMELAALAGELLLKNGGEIYRVQETLTRIIEAFGFSNHNVYVISNGLFITINEGCDDACSAVRHVPLGGVNLSRVAEINQISRDICSGKCSRQEAYLRLKECEKPFPENHLFMMLASGFGSAGFSMLFGGSVLDGVYSFFIGFVLQVLLYYLSSIRMSRFMNNMIGSFYVTIASAIVLYTGLELAFDKIVIGAIIPLVPGYAFTTSIREFFNSDYLSGMIHLLDALCTAFCIAIGVGVAILLIQYMGGGLTL